VEFALVALSGPSNIEKKVRELQSNLYRRRGLTSALALPVMIPLCLVGLRRIPGKPGHLREHLRRAVGRAAPYLTSGSVAECEGFLFWELAPEEELQSLRRNCESVFVSPDARPGDREAVRQPDLFPLARGFFLCSLQGSPQGFLQGFPQGQNRYTAPFLGVSEALRFPVKTAFVLRVHALRLEPGAADQARYVEDDRPSWKSLFWEKLGEIPLRKSRTAG
jgi:hypothetical protein